MSPGRSWWTTHGRAAAKRRQPARLISDCYNGDEYETKRLGAFGPLVSNRPDSAAVRMARQALCESFLARGARPRPIYGTGNEPGRSAQQLAHRVALIGTASDRQNGHVLVVAAGGDSFNRLACLTRRKTAKATMTKLTISLRNAP